jgi:4-hydroxybenzoate polyprenyltransferase
MKTLYNILRLKAWKVAFFSGDIGVCYLTIFYLVLIGNGSELPSLWGILACLVSLMFYLGYMYLINDFFDMPEDKIVGKKKAIYELKEWQIIALLVIITILNFTLVFSVIRNTIFSCVYTIAYFLATFYSAPPMRFKWRGWMGVVCDAIIEKPLPVLLVFIYFNHFHFDTLVFFAFMFSIQLSTIIQHEVDDYDADIKTNVKTLVTKIGKPKARQIQDNRLFPLFFSLSFLFYMIILIKIPIAGTAILVLFFVGLAIIYALKRKKILHDEDVLFYVPLPVHVVFVYILLSSVLTFILASMVLMETSEFLLVFLLFVSSQYLDVRIHYLPGLKQIFL